MPLGDKVGDAYIEVTPILNEKGFEAKAQKMLADKEKALGKTAKKAQLQRLNDSISAQRKLSEQKQKSESDDLAHSIRLISARERVEKASNDRRIKAVAHVSQLRAKYEKEALSEAYKLNEEFDRKIDRHRRKTDTARSRLEGKVLRRRGSNNRGVGLAGGITDALQNVTSVLPGQIEKLLNNPAVAAAAVGIGTELVGMIGAAAAIATSAGVLTGGIALAIKADPKLQAAGKELGNQLFIGLQASAKETLAPSIQKAFDFLKGSNFANGVIDDFRTMFASLAPTIVPLTSDLAKGISNITGGIKDFVNGSGKEFIAILGKGFVQVSEAVQGFFHDLDTAGPGLKSFGQDIFTVASAAIQAAGAVIKFAASVRDLLDFQDTRTEIEKLGNTDKLFAGLRENIARYDAQLKDSNVSEAGKAEITKARAESIKELDHATQLLAGKYNQERAAALAAGGGNKTLAATQDQVNATIEEGIKLQTQYDSILNRSTNATIAYEQAKDDLTASLKENGKTLDLTTQKGRDNYRATETAIKAAKDEALAVYEKTGSLEAAKKKYDQLVGPIKTNIGNTKANKKAVDDLKAAYGDFSKLPDVKKTVKVVVSDASLAAAYNAINNLTKGKTVTIDVVKRQIEKNKATGGPIYGPGTGTSDSIPANLSNGEFVIKASSAKSIGMSTLTAMNASGKPPKGYATGGSVKGSGRGATASQLRRFNSATATVKRDQTNLTALNKQVATLTASLGKFNDIVVPITDSLNSFKSLGAVGEGLDINQTIESLTNRKKKSESFTSSVEGLKSKGLSPEALKQIIDRGPESGLAESLAGATPAQIAAINAALTGDEALGQRLGNVEMTGGSAIAGNLANKKKSQSAAAAKLKRDKAAAAKLKPVKGHGATISYAGGKTSALFSSKELQNQQLKAGTYVTVLIDGKEVRAIVKQEQTRAQQKANQNIKSGRR